MTATVYVVTPSFNAVETIDRTILSVVSQAGDFRIHYHIQDGGSTDGTVARLQYWQEELDSGRFPIQNRGVYFSYASEPDTGLYDALIRGFEALYAHKDSFMTWINADDVLMTGSCAFIAAVYNQFSRAQVSWVGGSVSILRDDMVIEAHDRPISGEALRNGLCDGRHWPFVQQEGTYFRRWLWDAVEPRKSLLPLRLAGDWNLWRLFAQKVSLIQAPMALGSFRLHDQQLSAKHRDKYLDEMDSLVPEAVRAAKLKELVESGGATRRKIRSKYPGNVLSVYEDNAIDQANTAYRTVFKSDPPAPKKNRIGERLLFEGKPVPVSDQAFEDLMRHAAHGPDVSIFDHGWQFPAMTEHQAALSLARVRGHGGGCRYVAYPWANLIDKIEAGAADREAWLASFRTFCRQIPKGSRRITVCQHILARKYISLFREAGVTAVFWSHATRGDVEEGAQGHVRFLPFPLYPVQVPEALPEAAPEADGQPRPHLFSFIGARANQHYLTEARNWILDLLKDDPRGLIVGRDGWHYEKVVYDLQIRGTATGADAPALVDDDASAQFRASLVSSVFSLCPSGSGPNTIRLWESIGAGAIPVILADTWAPPGDRRLWDMGAVFCAETPEAIRALPDRLAAIAAEPGRLVQMRQALRQLWLLYGPQAFVTDVQAFLLAEAAPAAAHPAAHAPALPVAVPDDAAGARRMLLAWSGSLLCDPAATLAALEGGAARVLDTAAAMVAGTDRGTDLAAHYRAALRHARSRAGDTPRAAPAVLRKTAPRVAFLGRHAIRTPLSYVPLRRLVGDRLAFVDDPAAADLILSGFNLDWRENVAVLQPLLARPRPPKLVVMSEEPLWDVTWSGPFTGRDGRMTVKDTEIRYAFISHETSDVFHFDRLPYFVLTDNRYPVRYANLMARFAGMTPDALLRRWQAAPVTAAFFVEKREGEIHSGSFPERDITRLSAYRSAVAAQTPGAGVLRVGLGWGVPVRRQDLPDWHLDKLAQLDGRTRMVAAYENVHQHDYISEKIFDAFATGGVPVYWAGPRHRVFDLVPATAMVNTVDLDAAAAARRIAAFVPDRAFAESWLATCARLAALFGDAGAIAAERRRVAEAAVAELLALA